MAGFIIAQFLRELVSSTENFCFFCLCFDKCHRRWEIFPTVLDLALIEINLTAQNFCTAFKFIPICINFRRNWPLLRAPLLPSDSDSDFGQSGKKESCWMFVVWRLSVQAARREKTICCGFSLLEVVCFRNHLTSIQNHYHCHWVTRGPLTWVNLDRNRCR